jgi:hypothetical protein
MRCPTGILVDVDDVRARVDDELVAVVVFNEDRGVLLTIERSGAEPDREASYSRRFVPGRGNSNKTISFNIISRGRVIATIQCSTREMHLRLCQKIDGAR